MRPSNNVSSQAIPPQPSSRRTLPIKRADAEPLSREDIQYDLLEAIFNDRHAVFTDQSFEDTSSRIPKKVTFCELYTCTLIASPRCSKVLREKMSETPEFAIDFAKIALLANVGRINTTMAFFPEMRTVLRSYHPIPSLQKTDANLQDAPRIKNCLKACLLPAELSNVPSTPAEILAKGKSGIIPTTSVVNLVFVLSNHSVPISKTHFETPFDFLDLFLPVNASSASRARAFLWLIFHYLEAPSTHNPFADDFADRHPGKIPRLEMLTTQQRLLENIDTEDELQYGRRMAQYRSRFLQKQIADEEKDRQMFADGLVKGSNTSPPRGHVAEDGEVNNDDSLVPHETTYKTNTRPDVRRQEMLPIHSERTMLERESSVKLSVNVTSKRLDAWHMAISTDPLLNSDEEVDSEHVMIDYERRVHILNVKVRSDPSADRVRAPDGFWTERDGPYCNG